MIRSFSSNQFKNFTKLCLTNNCRSIATTTTRNDLYDDWKKLAEKQMKGKNPDKLINETAEVIKRIQYIYFN